METSSRMEPPQSIITPPPSPPSCPSELYTTQVYSRSGIAYLLDKRAEIGDAGIIKFINKLANNRKKTALNCSQAITYKLARSAAGKMGWGRYYGNFGSLEALESRCRGTICADYYHDMDIENCQLVLLLQFAKRYYNRELPELESYIQNRETILAKISRNRSEAKEEIIRILFGGINKHDITLGFSNEIKKFTKFLAERPEYQKLFAAVQYEDNKYGKFLSYILQTEERTCMLAMKNAFEELGWSVDVLAYDGVLIRKRDNMNPSDAITKIEDTIVKTTGYTVTIKEKPLVGYDIPEIEEELVPGVSVDAYETMKESFERNHFFHCPSNKITEVLPNNTMLFKTTSEAGDYYNCQWRFRTGSNFTEFTSFIHLWLKDPKRRNVMSIDMKPSDDPTVYSPPLAFAYSRVEPVNDPSPYLALWNLLLESVVPVLEQREFVLDYLAHMLQKPFELPKMGIVLMGDKGCGKDTIVDFILTHVIGYIYGINYSENPQFWAPHDLGRMNKFLVKLEEADGKLIRQRYSDFKARITADHISFNPKGKDEINCANYNRFFLTLNPDNGNMIPTDGQERRLFFADCGNALIGKLDVWEQIRTVLFTDSGGRAVADSLLARSHRKFPCKVIVSDLAANIVEATLPVEEMFLRQWDGVEAKASEVYQLYVTYSIQNNLPYCRNAKSFGCRLVPYLSKIIWKRRTEYGVAYFKR